MEIRIFESKNRVSTFLWSVSKFLRDYGRHIPENGSRQTMLLTIDVLIICA